MIVFSILFNIQLFAHILHTQNVLQIYKFFLYVQKIFNINPVLIRFFCVNLQPQICLLYLKY